MRLRHKRSPREPPYFLHIYIIFFSLYPTIDKKNATQSVLLTPVKDKYTLFMEDDKLRVGATSMQGWRSTMEDAHCIKLDLPNLPEGVKEDDCAFAAVFDGHCGAKMAQACSQHLCNWLTMTPEFQDGNYKEALRKAYINGDANLQKMFPEENSGCTGNAILIVENKLYCANTGDTRAVLCRRGEAVALSEDHKPTNPAEERRINKAGMQVLGSRVGGILSLSRAFGDFPFKDSNLPPEDRAITVVPDIQEIELTAADEFVIVACDGVWDMLKNQEAVDFIRNEVADHNDVSLACERLLNSCLAATPSGLGTDNMTIVVLEFKSRFLRQIESAFAERPEPTPNNSESDGSALILFFFLVQCLFVSLRNLNQGDHSQECFFRSFFPFLQRIVLFLSYLGSIGRSKHSLGKKQIWCEIFDVYLCFLLSSQNDMAEIEKSNTTHKEKDQRGGLPSPFVISVGTLSSRVESIVMEESFSSREGLGWFKAGRLEIKRAAPPPSKEYLFDTDSSDEDSERGELHEDDTILLYELRAEPLSAPLLPSYIARKIPLPLHPPLPMRTLSQVPPLPRDLQRGSDGREGRKVKSLDREHTISGGTKSFTFEGGFVEEDPRSLDADAVAMAREAERLQVRHRKRENIKRVPFSLISEVTSLPCITFVFPILVIVVDLSLAITSVVSMVKSDGEAAMVSVFFFFFLGIVTPDCLALFCIYKNRSWHSSLGLQAILWPTVIFSILIPFTSPLLLLHPPLMGLLALYILRHRRGMRLTRGTFTLLRSIYLWLSVSTSSRKVKSTEMEGKVPLQGWRHNGYETFSLQAFKFFPHQYGMEGKTNQMLKDTEKKLKTTVDALRFKNYTSIFLFLFLLLRLFSINILLSDYIEVFSS
eukprot:gene1918-1161_t